MIIHMRGVNLDLTPSLKEHVERAVQHALDRFEQRVSFVEVSLSDVNGPRKGPDMRCQMLVSLRHAPRVVVEHHDRDLYVAVDRAAGRVKRTVRRKINRQRDVRQREQQHAAALRSSYVPAV